MSEIKTNKISSLASNNDITIDPDGTGDTIIASNNVGIGITSPEARLDVLGNSDDTAALKLGPNANFGHHFYDSFANGDLVIKREVSGVQTETMRLTRSGGNLLVAKSASDVASVGFEAKSDGAHFMTRDGGEPLKINRKTSDGSGLSFAKDGTTVGSIGVGNGLFVSAASKTGIRFPSGHWRPMNNGSDSDNAIDLGSASFRFDDIYATNATIQTSDQNEKQQIASLTSAEITAAKAISALFKTFKWNDSVTENGDNARTHTGVIAQQVETAMTDAGLDAGDYAFFISTTWHEDADGNEVDADTEGATERNRKGIRYPELLSFIGAATEQRLSNIETRLAALENA